jgi:ribA/ribD-fused uncharacterized protein
MEENMTKIIDSFRGKYAFLSNFYNYTFFYEGKPYPTMEHFFQSRKTSDPELQEWIRLSSTPRISKTRGRGVTLRPDWEEDKIKYMRIGLSLKFALGSGMANLLDRTGDALLIEGNTWGDRIWGMTRDRDGEWVGENYLGKLLMMVREQNRYPYFRSVNNEC